VTQPREERTYTGTTTTPPADRVNSPSTSSTQGYTVNLPPINPTPRLCLWVTQRSVPWVMWEAVTGMQRTHPVEGYYNTHWLTWSGLLKPRWKVSC